MLVGKRILLGVSGGIAAYKSVSLSRLLQKAGAEVRVVMTQAAQKFVQPLTFEALSRHRVYVDLFPESGDPEVVHVQLGKWADWVIVAPATADFIGKMAHGLADDVLTCVLLATEAPVLIAPAMESQMWEHRAVRDNVRTLRNRGCEMVAPEEGPLASGAQGMGRMAEPEEIAAVIGALAGAAQSLAGRRVVVTAGRTEQPIDPVRFITNRSTGKMGYAIADQARRRGAEVTLISGPTELTAPTGVSMVSIRTVAELKAATLRAYENADALIMTAAVLDFRPEEVAESKIKKRDGGLSLRLLPNEDFLIPLGETKGERVVIGFAMETDDALANARKKLEEKHLDLIVLNELNVEGAGFGVDTNVVTLIAPHRDAVALPLMPKRDVADRILDWLVSHWEQASGRGVTECR